MSTAAPPDHPKPDDDRLDRVFMALSNRTRRGMLEQLSVAPVTISELAAPYDMTLPGASKHVRVLEDAGLVERQIEGRVHHCRIEVAALNEANEWLDRNRRFWEERLASVAEHLSEDNDA